MTHDMTHYNKSNYMKRLLLLCILALCTLATFAIPAKPGLRAVQQPDGSTLMVQLIGDEYFHYLATSDGLPLVQTESGAYVYATMQDEQLVPTHVMAHEPAMRKTQEHDVIRQLQPVSMPASAKLLAQQNNERRAAHAKARRKAGSQPSTGTESKRGLIILVDYPDAPMTHTREEFDAMMNQKDYNLNGSIGSLSDYFYDQSYGQLKIDFDVVGPFTASQPLRYYGEDYKINYEDKHLGTLVTEAVHMAHEAGTDFSVYDWMGDGNVDQVFLIYAGYAQSEGAPAYTIWPMESTLRRYYDVYNDGNGPITLDGVTVNTFACSSELRGKEGYILHGIGTAAHEFAHCIGLPDFYNTENDKDKGVMGSWSLMDYGNFNKDGDVPAAFTSYERMYCGWLNPVVLNSDTTIQDMRPITEAPEAYIIYNQANPDEYYMLENHQPLHNSDRFHAWDSGAPGHGMMVLHVDYDEKAWRRNTVNEDPNRQRMSFIPANNIYKPFSKDAYAGHLFPGTSGQTALTYATIPAPQLNTPNSDGSKLLHLAIVDITETDGLISFNILKDFNLPSPIMLEAAEVDSTSFVARWQAVEGATSYTLEVTDLLASPNDTFKRTLYKMDFSKMEPFASATEVGTNTIDDKIEEYLNMKGWKADNSFVAPQGVRIVMTNIVGALSTPAFPAPNDGTLTIDVTLAKDTVNPKDLDIFLYDAETSISQHYWSVKNNGELHSFTAEGIDYNFSLKYFVAGKIPLDITYLAARAACDIVQTYDYLKSTTFPLTDLRPNGRYSYRVMANTSYGFTSWSDPVEVTLSAPTSINNTPSQPAQPRTIYNVQGQRLSKPQPGLNIIDGKKVRISRNVYQY